MEHQTDWTGSGIDEEEEVDDYQIKVMSLPKLRDQESSWTWQDNAMCVSFPEVSFFPGSKAEAVKCQTICDTCVVKSACLDFCLRNHEKTGVWGGLTANQRKEMYK